MNHHWTEVSVFYINFKLFLLPRGLYYSCSVFLAGERNWNFNSTENSTRSSSNSSWNSIVTPLRMWLYQKLGEQKAKSFRSNIFFQRSVQLRSESVCQVEFVTWMLSAINFMVNVTRFCFTRLSLKLALIIRLNRLLFILNLFSCLFQTSAKTKNERKVPRISLHSFSHPFECRKSIHRQFIPVGKATTTSLDFQLFNDFINYTINVHENL